MNLVALPIDLQDLVVQFAYEIKLKDLKKDLTVITEVKSWNLHPSFIRGRVWCDRMWGLVSNPLDVYLPLTWFQDRFVFFDMGLVDEVLGRLDFRKGCPIHGFSMGLGNLPARVGIHGPLCCVFQNHARESMQHETQLVWVAADLEL